LVYNISIKVLLQYSLINPHQIVGQRSIFVWQRLLSTNQRISHSPWLFQSWMVSMGANITYAHILSSLSRWVLSFCHFAKRALYPSANTMDNGAENECRCPLIRTHTHAGSMVLLQTRQNTQAGGGDGSLSADGGCGWPLLSARCGQHGRQ
jgi:hypothetical protein